MAQSERDGLGIKNLPKDLFSALEALEQDGLLREVLGEELRGNYLAQKREEWKEYRMSVSAWEVAQYIDRF